MTAVKEIIESVFSEDRRILEPSVGDIVYQRKDSGKYAKVRIIDGEFLDSKYGRLSNFWKWENLETGEIEEDYGCFYREVSNV